MRRLTLILLCLMALAGGVWAALPNKIDPTLPADTDLVSAGAGQIRGVKQYLVDVFGLPNNSNVTAAVSSISTAGVLTISQAGFTTASTAAIGTPAVLANSMLSVHGAVAFTAAGLTPSGPAIQSSGGFLNLLAGTSGGVGITTSGATIPTSGAGQLQVKQDTNSSATITAIARGNVSTDYNALEFRQSDGTILANLWNAAGGADPLRIKATDGVQLHAGNVLYGNTGLSLAALPSGVSIPTTLDITPTGSTGPLNIVNRGGDIEARTGLIFSVTATGATTTTPHLYMQAEAIGVFTNDPKGLLHLGLGASRQLTFTKGAAGAPPSGTVNTVSLRVVPGTNASTCRLEAVAGNATNVYTITDNIAGC